MSTRSSARGTLAAKLGCAGIRLTSQRRAILDIIEHEGGHLDAARIQDLARARGHRVDRATVYRTLALLKAHGLVEELDFLHVKGEQHYYESTGRAEHLHACCRTCGKVVELPSATQACLREELLKRTGFVADSIRVEVAGCCKVCAASGRCSEPDSSAD